MRAPGRIRTRDPLLRRHLRSIAARRLVSPHVAFNCMDGGCPWLGVARILPLLAPYLAPQISLASLTFERAKTVSTTRRHFPRAQLPWLAIAVLDITGVCAFRNPNTGRTADLLHAMQVPEVRGSRIRSGVEPLTCANGLSGSR